MYSQLSLPICRLSTYTLWLWCGENLNKIGQTLLKLQRKTLNVDGMTDSQKEGMTDRLQAVYTLKLRFAGGGGVYKRVLTYFQIARIKNMRGNKNMFPMLGKFPFLLQWKNVLSSSHALHFRFIRYKSVTRTVISVNRPCIIRCISGNMRFIGYMSGTHAVIMWFLSSTHRS